MNIITVNTSIMIFTTEDFFRNRGDSITGLCGIPYILIAALDESTPRLNIGEGGGVFIEGLVTHSNCYYLTGTGIVRKMALDAISFSWVTYEKVRHFYQGHRIMHIDADSYRSVVGSMIGKRYLTVYIFKSYCKDKEDYILREYDVSLVSVLSYDDLIDEYMKVLELDEWPNETIYLDISMRVSNVHVDKIVRKIQYQCKDMWNLDGTIMSINRDLKHKYGTDKTVLIGLWCKVTKKNKLRLIYTTGLYRSRYLLKMWRNKYDGLEETRLENVKDVYGKLNRDFYIKAYHRIDEIKLKNREIDKRIIISLHGTLNEIVKSRGVKRGDVLILNEQDTDREIVLVSEGLSLVPLNPLDGLTQTDLMALVEFPPNVFIMEIVAYPSVDHDDHSQMLWREPLLRELRYRTTVDESHYMCKKNQAFVKRVFRPNTDYNSILLYHVMGSGKTDCSAIMYENMKGYYKKMVILVKGPGQVTSIKSTLERWMRRYLGFNTDEEIKDYYSCHILIEKHHSFTKMAQDNLDEFKAKYSNCLIILDEVHNLRAESASTRTKSTRRRRVKPTKGKAEKVTTADQIINILHKLHNIRVILMTGTPMYDNVNELRQIVRLLHVDKRLDIDQATEYDEYYTNRISYCNEVGNKADVTIVGNDECLRLIEEGVVRHRFIYLEMTGVQRDYYNMCADVIRNKIHATKKDTESSFMRTLQSASLGAYMSEDMHANMDMEALNKALFVGKYKLATEVANVFKIAHTEGRLHEYSVKFAHMYNTMTSTKGKAYIFNELVHGFGVRFYAAMLSELGYEIIDVKDSSVSSNIFKSKAQRILVITGQDNIGSEALSRLVDDTFNHESNVNGEYVKALLGSVTTGEGWNFMAVRQVYVLTPHWNMGRIDQVEARVIRTGSHSTLEPEDRKVNVYRYVASAVSVDEILDSDTDRRLVSSDLYKYTLSESKEMNIKEKEVELQEAAIDMPLNVTDYDDPHYHETIQANSLYVDYYRDTFTEKLSTILCKHFLEDSGSSAFRWLDIQSVLTNLNVDTKALDVILYELSKDNRFIHYDGDSYKLMHSDGYYSMVSVTKDLQEPEAAIEDVVPHVNFADVHEPKDIELLMECEDEADMIMHLSKMDPVYVTKCLRYALRNKVTRIMHLFRGLWMEKDGHYYEWTTRFTKTNARYNINCKPTEDVLANKVFKISKVNPEKWTRCDNNECSMVAKELSRRLHDNEARYADCRFYCFIHSFTGCIYVKDMEKNDEVDERRVYRGRAITSPYDDKDLQEFIYAYIMLRSSTLPKLERYVKTRKLVNNIDEEEVMDTMRSVVTFDGDDNLLFKSYPHASPQASNAPTYCDMYQAVWQIRYPTNADRDPRAEGIRVCVNGRELTPENMEGCIREHMPDATAKTLANKLTLDLMPPNGKYSQCATLGIYAMVEEYDRSKSNNTLMPTQTQSSDTLSNTMQPHPTFEKVPTVSSPQTTPTPTSTEDSKVIAGCYAATGGSSLEFILCAKKQGVVISNADAMSISKCVKQGKGDECFLLASSKPKAGGYPSGSEYGNMISMGWNVLATTVSMIYTLT
ncbi:hypothetical protein HDU85_005898 [Gaertneriomyces sp. JEL0708]|nr:hypothetical protein HDU85_005898 [Gaertneriomyces sp. JEL0708]